MWSPVLVATFFVFLAVEIRTVAVARVGGLSLFSSSVVSDSLQPHGHQASLSFTIS